MYLIFDTETTGLPRNWNAPASDTENWPRMVQLGYLRCGESGEVLEKRSAIIKPEGYEIPAEAARVHGITTEYAMENGVELSGVLDEFSNRLYESKVLVAHNMDFDEKIISAEFYRKEHYRGLNALDGIGRKVCTMKTPAVSGFYGKWPKLVELHKKLFNEGFDGAHGALNDAEACAKCFFRLKERGMIPQR